MNSVGPLNSIPAASDTPANRQMPLNSRVLPYEGQAPTQLNMIPSQDTSQQRAMFNPTASSPWVFNWNTYRQANRGMLVPVFSLKKPPLRTQSRNNMMAGTRLYSNHNIPVQTVRLGILIDTNTSTNLHAHAASTQLQASTMQSLDIILNIHTNQNSHAGTGHARSLFSSTPPRLDNLPPEIRAQIYGYLFAGATLEASKPNMDRCSTTDQFSPYRLIENVNTSIISASRFFHKDALPFLKTATALEVPRCFGRHDPLANIPDEFLSSIKNIKVHIDSFVHINRRRLTSLQDVHVVHDVDAPDGFADIVRYMNTNGSVEDVIEMLFDDVFSWKWKQRQFAYLAAEEGFALKMTVYFSIWCPAPGKTGFDFEMDSATNTVVRTTGFIGSQEVAVDNVDQAKEDWEDYSGM